MADSGTLATPTPHAMYSARKFVRHLVVAVLIVTAVSLCLAPFAFARLSRNTINPEANISPDGRHLVVTGPIAGSTAGELADIRVTVTQRMTGAVAQGQTFLVMTGADQQWQIQASTQGNEKFEEGPAIAVAIPTTSARGGTTDAHQWLVAVTLTKQ